MGNLTITKIVLQEGRKTHFDAMGILTKVLSTAADNDFTLARDLLAIAYADGKLTEEEKKTICHICHTKDMEENLHAELFVGCSQKSVNMPQTRKAKEDYLIKMIRVMGADADSASEEIFLLEIIADKLGINKMQLLSLILINASRKNFPGDIGAKVMDSFLKHVIDVKGKSDEQNHQSIAKLYDAVASSTVSSPDTEENKRLLKEALDNATSILLENRLQRKDFHRAGLSFEDFLRYEAENAYQRWINY